MEKCLPQHAGDLWLTRQYTSANCSGLNLSQRCSVSRIDSILRFSTAQQGMSCWGAIHISAAIRLEPYVVENEEASFKRQALKGDPWEGKFSLASPWKQPSTSFDCGRS